MNQPQATIQVFILACEQLADPSVRKTLTPEHIAVIQRYIRTLLEQFGTPS
jgi:hypothetical protein